MLFQILVRMLVSCILNSDFVYFNKIKSKCSVYWGILSSQDKSMEEFIIALTLALACRST